MLSILWIAIFGNIFSFALGGIGDLFRRKNCELESEQFMKSRPQGCFDKRRFPRVYELITRPIVDKAAKGFKKCECELKKNIFQRVIRVFTVGFKQNCLERTEYKLCEEVVKEMNNPDCNVCRFVQISANRQRINRCVCDNLNGAFVVNFQAALTKCIATAGGTGIMQAFMGAFCPRGEPVSTTPATRIPQRELPSTTSKTTTAVAVQ